MVVSRIDNLPEVFTGTSFGYSAASRAVSAGKLRRIATNLYTRVLDEPVEQVVRRNLWSIAGLLFPGAVVVDRTAFENAPAVDGSIFLASRRKRDVALPGYTIRSRPGKGPLAGDQPFAGGLFLSSPARAYLENMSPSRARKGVSRRLSRRELELRLDRDLRFRGAPFAKRLRDDARALAPELGLSGRRAELDRLIGTLLGTMKVALATDVARARAAGAPYDPQRLELFEVLVAELNRSALPTRASPAGAREKLLPFFEAYFSNFIEGTEFEIDEARAIIFDARIPRGRPADAHDVLGTFAVVSDAGEIGRTPADAPALLALLRERHAQIMAGRPERAPGELKRIANRAGATTFVAPDLVEGTLARGYELYRTLREPIQRAVFMMFLISEVHPFEDGNGRVGRVMMNAELVAAREVRIVVPTVYRDNYLAALRALTHNRRAEPLVRALDFAQRWTAALDFSTYDGAVKQLRASHAFMDAREAEERGVRLVIPG